LSQSGTVVAQKLVTNMAVAYKITTEVNNKNHNSIHVNGSHILSVVNKWI